MIVVAVVVVVVVVVHNLRTVKHMLMSMHVPFIPCTPERGVLSNPPTLKPQTLNYKQPNLEYVVVIKHVDNVSNGSNRFTNLRK